MNHAQDPENTYDIRGDGFSFNFGDLDLIDPGIAVEDGWAADGRENGGDVLTVSWDTFDNAFGEIFGRVAVFLNGSEVAGMDNTVNNVVKSARTDVLGEPFEEVAISWSESEGLSVSYAGTAVYTNDAVNLTTEAGYRFAFAARTGDKDQDTFIDNVDLTTVAVPVPESASFEVLMALVAGGFALMRRSRRIGAARLARPSSRH